MLDLTSYSEIKNFILIKYVKKKLDAPKHVIKVNMDEWNDHQELMFDTMLEQLNYFYPLATVHVLTNEHHKNLKNLIWHYRPRLEDNHSTKLLLYGLLDSPAMYVDSDILIGRHFDKKHLVTKHPFNLYRLSTTRPLQSLTRKKLEVNANQQYNCGMIWIPRPSKQIVLEMQRIKKRYFNNRNWIEKESAWFHNDEHPVSYFVAKYEMKMRLFDDVNVFRSKCKDVFGVQSIHYTGVRNKNLFVKEYKELCKSRFRIFS